VALLSFEEGLQTKTSERRIASSVLESTVTVMYEELFWDFVVEGG